MTLQEDQVVIAGFELPRSIEAGLDVGFAFLCLKAGFGVSCRVKGLGCHFGGVGVSCVGLRVSGSYELVSCCWGHSAGLTNPCHS